MLLQVIDEAKSLSKLAFTTKYSHPWLLVETPKSRSSGSSGSDIISPSTSKEMPPLKAAVATFLTPTVLMGRADEFVLFPLVKSDRNPWTERILVGRARNNDIILPIQSVSKVQCYFTKKGKQYQLTACQASNPVRFDGTVLAPETGTADAVDGSQLVLGTICAHFLESATLHYLLSGKPG